MDPTKLTSTNPNAGTHLSDLNPLKGIFRTAGVQNVEKAFSRGGGMPNQKTATGTNTSSADIVEPREDKLVSLILRVGKKVKGEIGGKGHGCRWAELS